MKICPEHWAKVRAAVESRGMGHLGAKTGEQAAKDAESQLRGEETSYDPLMACNWMITSRALESGGLYLMTPKPDGSDHCPLCEAIEHRPEGKTIEESERYWIDGPADAALAHCRERGLLSEA